jgi:hypothetical protein
LGKIAPIPRDGATYIVYGPRCTIESLCCKLVGGCRKGGYGCRGGIGHPTPFVANPQFEAILQALKTIVDKNVEYNDLCLAQHEYTMCPNDVISLPRKHNLIIQFQQNLRWFSHSRHVINFAEDSYVGVGDLSLPKLEISFSVVGFYGMNFHPGAPYWT